MAVLPWAALEVHRLLGEQEVVIRRRDVDATSFEPHTLAGVLCRKRACPRENRREHARRGRNVQDDEHRRRKVLRKPGSQGAQGFDSAGGRSDDDDVPSRRLLTSPHLCLLPVAYPQETLVEAGREPGPAAHERLASPSAIRLRTIHPAR